MHVDGPRRGTFRDFEAGKSGGVLDLAAVQLEALASDGQQLTAWLGACRAYLCC